MIIKKFNEDFTAKYGIIRTDWKPLPNIVKKGDEVKVTFKLMVGYPEMTVEAKTDSEYNDYLNCDSFSFLYGGDMMFIAQWDGKKWICN